MFFSIAVSLILVIYVPYFPSRFGYSIFASLSRDSSFFVYSINESHSSPMDESACSEIKVFLKGLNKNKCGCVNDFYGDGCY